MSSRNFRKVVGYTLPPPDSDDSDAEYDPAATRHRQSQTYAGLLVSDDTESEPNPEVDDEEGKQDEAAACPITPRGGARKKKPQKRGKGKKGRQNSDAFNPGPSTSGLGSGRRAARHYNSRAHGEELDEIDISILEVNALLGEPPPAPEPPKEVEFDQARIILKVEARHLNVAHELRRLFGPDDPEEVRQRNKTQPHRIRILKRVMVGPTHDTKIYDFKKRGLSMSIDSRDGEIISFVYDHDKDHQKMHNAFLSKYANNILRPGTGSLNLDEATRNMHVEPMLEIADTLFGMDENGLGNELVENIVTYLQFVAHPSFNLASMNVRLSYHYIENRPFHVAMLKYMYLLSNKACHRTALEIAKMLLNVDPSDPLAMLFVIDTLALRAREHEWLIEAIEFFDKQRQAKMLYNMLYSFALAHFHVARKNKRDLAGADLYLQNAMMAYPRVVYRVLEYASVNEPVIQTHILFATEQEALAGEGLSELMLIYAKLTWARWREPEVMEWFIRNAKDVITQYDNNGGVRERVRTLAMLRHGIFQVWPTEIMRHVSIIRSMSNLLLETTLNPPTRPTSAWDPLFDRGINRYSYRTRGDQARSAPAPATGGRALLYSYNHWNDQSFLLAHLIASSGRTHHSSVFDPWNGVLECLLPAELLDEEDAYESTLDSRSVSPDAVKLVEDNFVDNDIDNAGNASDNAAGNASDNAAGNAADNAAGNAADNAAGNANDNAAGNAADNAAGNAADNAAGNAGDNTAGNAVDNAEAAAPRYVDAAVQVPSANILHIQQLHAFFRPCFLNGVMPGRIYHPNVPAYAINFLNMFHELYFSGDNNEAYFRDSEESCEESELDDYLFNPPPEADDNDNDYENVYMGAHGGQAYVPGAAACSVVQGKNTFALVNGYYQPTYSDSDESDDDRTKTAKKVAKRPRRRDDDADKNRKDN